MRTDMKIEMPKSLTEMVMARLEQAIVDGEFGLGEAISEETLAKTFGVSRTPVREALIRLESTGLIQPGSMFESKYRIRLRPDQDPTAVAKSLETQFPNAGWEITDRSNGAPGTRRAGTKKNDRVDSRSFFRFAPAGSE